jgi:hypothetical protein
MIRSPLRRYRAPFRALDTSFAVRFWVACTTSMFGFDLRQAQAAEAGISVHYLQKVFAARATTFGHFIRSLRLDLDQGEPSSHRGVLCLWLSRLCPFCSKFPRPPWVSAGRFPWLDLLGARAQSGHLECRRTVWRSDATKDTAPHFVGAWTTSAGWPAFRPSLRTTV